MLRKAKVLLGAWLRHGNRVGDPSSAPRCLARTRRGTACQCPAIRGRRRCRLHGGRSTGPKSISRARARRPWLALGIRLKHEIFVYEYLIDLNATAAYKRAGYRAQGNAASVNASRLRWRPDVRRALREVQAAQFARINARSSSDATAALGHHAADVRRAAAGC